MKSLQAEMPHSLIKQKYRLTSQNQNAGGRIMDRRQAGGAKINNRPLFVN